ncbi:MAG: hypothetical protein H6720_28695 [Sandaracinus sp.]|nr:hypothetical protein [Sandaracinus sp.]
MRAGTDDVTEASLGAAFALQGSAGLDASGTLTDFRLGLPSIASWRTCSPRKRARSG